MGENGNNMDSNNTNSRIPKLRFPGFTGEWMERQLKNSFDERIEKNRCELPLLSLGEKGLVYQSDTARKDNSNADKCKYLRVAIGDIAYNTMRMWQGRCVCAEIEGIVSPAYTVCKPKNGIDSMFHYYLFKTNRMIQLFHQNSQGLVNDTLNLKYEAFSKIRYLLPPTLSEQQKIASCLSELDDLITAQGQKVDALKEKKKGMMQRMFPQQGETTPRLRFPGFTADWVEMSFGELYKKHNVKNDLTFGIDKIISVANMYYKNDATVGDEDYLRTYNIFRLGDIAYEGNKSANYAFGRFVENTIGDGIVSHVFDVYSPILHVHCLDYWKYAINYERIIRPVLEKSTIKSTMMTNLIAKDFLKQKILVPTFAEQQKIAEFLSELDKTIEAETTKFDTLKNHKKGLMQQLFPQPTK